MNALVRRTSLAATLFLGYMVGTVVEAEALCLPRFETGSPAYVYVNTFIDSLTYAKAGSDLTDRGIMSLSVPGVGGLTEFMVNVKQAGEQYRCAASLLEQYRASPSRAVKTSAETAHFVYTNLRALDREILDDFLSTLDAQAPIRTGALLDKVSDAVTKKNETWKLLVVAAAGTTHALVLVPEGKDEKLSRLSVTQVERAALLRSIESGFGADVKQGFRAGVSALDGAAALLYGFLADQGWKASDSP